MAELFGRMPDAAYKRQSELTSGAWMLYSFYVKYRYHDTGQCDPSRETLAAELNFTPSYVSNCKKELELKGWIRRVGKRQVDLLVGEFPKLKVKVEVGNFPQSKWEISHNQSSKVGNFPQSKWEISHYENSSPYIPEQSLVTEVEAAAAAAEISASPEENGGEFADLTKPNDAAFVAHVRASSGYPTVDLGSVAAKLSLEAPARYGRQATRADFLAWCKREWERPKQPGLPGVSGDVVNISAPTAATGAMAAKCEPDCPACHGTGWAMFEGAARRCTAAQGRASPATATGTDGS